MGEVACVPNASTFQTDAFLDLHPAPEGYPGEAALFTAESKPMRGMFWEEDSWAWSFCGMFDATHVDAELNGEFFAKGSKMEKGNLAARLPPLALLFRKLVYRIVGQAATYRRWLSPLVLPKFQTLLEVDRWDAATCFILWYLGGRASYSAVASHMPGTTMWLTTAHVWHLCL